jgi:ribosomal protein S18 acetylase RimI-like enzyme
MKIKTLEKTPIETIVHCLNEAFSEYFVKVPTDLHYWSRRFNNVKVAPKLSWGVFDNGQLVGFIINAINEEKGKRYAYNACTGVVEEHRGNRLVQKMYEAGIPELKANGIARCTLEVIEQNEKAVKAYKSVGFKIKKRLKCYNGSLTPKGTSKIVETNIESVATQDADPHYSLDNRLLPIQMAGNEYSTYKVWGEDTERPVGYFIMNPQNGYVAQLESPMDQWDALFDGIGQINKEIKINNVHEERTGLIKYIQQQKGMINPIDQFEMEMKL